MTRSANNRDGGRAHPLFVERVADKKGRKLVKLSWGTDQIIMTQAIAENIANWILYREDESITGFASPVGKAALAVEKLVSAETVQMLHDLERSA